MSDFNIYRSTLGEDGREFMEEVHLSKRISCAKGQGVGIGPAAIRAFEDAGIETFAQLVGQFLVFKTADCGMQQHCQRFYDWLSTLRDPKSTSDRCPIAGHRAGIVEAVGTRAETICSGIFDRSTLKKMSKP